MKNTGHGGGADVHSLRAAPRGFAGLGRGARRYSVIIPVLGEEAAIGECLDRLDRMEEMNEAEVIVVDGGGGSTLQAISGSYRFDLLGLVSPPGRGVQMNAGAEASSGSILIFLHVDTVPPADMPALVEHALQSSGAGAFSLRIDSGHRWLRMGAALSNLRGRITRVPYGDQTFFMRRELFFRAGGYPHIPIMEDVALMLALKRMNAGVTILPQPSLTSARRWEKEGAFKGTFRNWLLYTLYRVGVSPRRLAAWYRPQGESGGPVADGVPGDTGGPVTKKPQCEIRQPGVDLPETRLMNRAQGGR